ncbi:MAG: biotin transport system substrate-specific component [Desulfovibrionales bacterium]|nr:biotin transport system substrate-specific component [Desulfovibrionales bacterium]
MTQCADCGTPVCAEKEVFEGEKMGRTHSLSATHRLVWAALMAALIAVGAYFQFPLGPVPFSMQPFFVFLAGFVLGPRLGALSACLYLAAGLVGLPVFAGGAAGLGYALGPTGGFMPGFAAAAFLCGLSVKAPGKGPSSWLSGMSYGIAGLALMYAMGVARLVMVVPSLSVAGGIAAMSGFAALDVVKLAGAVAAARLLARSGVSPS